MHSLILAWASWILAFLMPAQRAEVQFYDETFYLTYPGEVLANGTLTIDEVGLGAYYSTVAQKDWSLVLSELQAQRSRWQLNDWLYFKMIDATVTQIAGFISEDERRVLQAHLLALSGYDVRLCYDSTSVYVYCLTREPLFEVPMISDGDEKFVNLTAALAPRNSTTRSLKFHPLRLNELGKDFSLSLAVMPRLTPKLQERVYTFTYDNQVYKIHGVSDRTVVEWMEDYPFFAEGKYVETPLSQEAGARLCEELRPLLAGKTHLQQLQLLVSFTRGAFVYREDKRSYGFSKPMIPDEVLYYPVSDCEDRSALFFALVRDLLNLPVVAIAYNDHLSVAVSSPELRGKAFFHEGRPYHVCDPTGPANSSDIGDHPYGYANRRFNVVASYLPGT